MKGFFKEFENFAVRGNAIDLAVGVLIGASFNQVTTALANNILTPLIGLFGGGFDFTKLAFHINKNVTLQYGVFIQAVVNFVLTALILFVLVKTLSGLVKKRKAEEKKPAENPELKVLMEIRDELKAR